MKSGGSLSIWFFIGLSMLVNGILITGAGVWELASHAVAEEARNRPLVVAAPLQDLQRHVALEERIEGPVDLPEPAVPQEPPDRNRPIVPGMAPGPPTESGSPTKVGREKTHDPRRPDRRACHRRGKPAGSRWGRRSQVRALQAVGANHVLGRSHGSVPPNVPYPRPQGVNPLDFRTRNEAGPERKSRPSQPLAERYRSPSEPKLLFAVGSKPAPMALASQRHRVRDRRLFQHLPAVPRSRASCSSDWSRFESRLRPTALPGVRRHGCSRLPGRGSRRP